MNALFRFPCLACILSLSVLAKQAQAAPRGEESAAAQTFYVSPQGDDTWTGRRATPNRARKEGPFATLERARDAIRALKRAGKTPTGGVTVALRGGTYFRARAFTLNAEDSGSAGAPIVYRPYKNEEVRLVGGKEIRGWKPVSDPDILSRLNESVRGKIMEIDLKAFGVTDFGRITNGGHGRTAQPEVMSLLFNDLALPIARYPNEGWAKVGDTPAGRNGDRFTFEGDRPAHWKSLEDVWLYGYWTYDWADSFEQIVAIDTERHAFVTAPPLPTYGYTKGHRYFALNVLEELDAPGEWYINRSAGRLYLYPPTPLDTARTVVTTLQEPLITLNNAAYITVQGVTLEATRGDAATVDGGSHDLIAGCVIRNANRYGIVFNGGTENGAQSCDLYALGLGGIILNGGDRATLTPGKLYAINNHIHHFSTWFRTYRPAVSLGGVGNIVAHNRIHDAPHSAIQGGGNEHLIEFNEIYKVCLETGDAGAFYMGRDFTQRGNLIRYNYFHHLRAGSIAGEEGFTEVMAVYLDDCLSGETIFGNVFYKAGRAAMIGGGRDNTIENNIFVDCAPAIHVDARGKGWASFWFNGKDPTIMEGLKAVKHTQPPYSARYPQLAHVLDDDPAMPKGNRITRNIAVGGRWLDLYDQLTDKTVLFLDNFTQGDPLFVAPEREDFRLKPDSPVWKLGFQRIPIEKIGLVKDAYRKTLPLR